MKDATNMKSRIKAIAAATLKGIRSISLGIYKLATLPSSLGRETCKFFMVGFIGEESQKRWIDTVYDAKNELEIVFCVVDGVVRFLSFVFVTLIGLFFMLILMVPCATVAYILYIYPTLLVVVGTIFGTSFAAVCAIKAWKMVTKRRGGGDQ